MLENSTKRTIGKGPSIKQVIERIIDPNWLGFANSLADIPKGEMPMIYFT